MYFADVAFSIDQKGGRHGFKVVLFRAFSRISSNGEVNRMLQKKRLRFFSRFIQVDRNHLEPLTFHRAT